MTSNLTSKIEGLLNAFEKNDGQGLDPDQTFDLFSSIGELRYCDWRASFVPKEETEAVVVKSEKLYLRFRNSLKLRIRVLRLEEGMVRLIEKIEEEIADPDRRWKHMAYDDLEASLMWYLDKLGYALRALEEVGFVLSEKLSQRISSDYETVNAVLPRLMDKFRSENDFPEFIEGAFPKFFWWRRWSRYTTYEAILKGAMDTKSR